MSLKEEYYYVSLTVKEKEALEDLGYSFKQVCNNIKPGDKVRILNHPVKDAYQEIWHDVGDELIVRSIAKDGEGIMFGSELGTHFTNVERI